MNIQRATAVDLPFIAVLLSQDRLPADDLTATALEHFLVLRHEGVVSGAVGLEPQSGIALLRSLVVSSDVRGRGFGGLLTDAAEALATRLGVTSIYLLTTSADAFFAMRGYQRVERSEAPQAIRSTTQFSALCPASAVLMSKRLARNEN